MGRMKYSEIYNRLPKQLQNAILSTDTEEAFEVVRQKHKLHVDQLEPLQRLTLSVLYGILRPDQFTESLGRELPIDSSEVASIALDMNTLVFQPVRESLMELAAHSSNPTDRESLLQEIQRPTPTPISGRRYVVVDRVRGEEVGSVPAEGVGSLASNSGPEARLPGTNSEDDSRGLSSDVATAEDSPHTDTGTESSPTYASILDEKAGAVTNSAATATTNDPYREMPV